MSTSRSVGKPAGVRMIEASPVGSFGGVPNLPRFWLVWGRGILIVRGFKRRNDVARVCDVCGKGTLSGTTIVRRGLPKKTGGIGLHTTGITKRKFLPNLHKVRVVENGTTLRRTVCASCIRRGRVVKAK